MRSGTLSRELSSIGADLGDGSFAISSVSASAVGRSGSGDERSDRRRPLDDDEECLERGLSPSYDESSDMLESCRLARSSSACFSE